MDTRWPERPASGLKRTARLSGAPAKGASNLEIYDKTGRLMARSDPPDSRCFEGMTIHNAALAGVELELISFDESDLRGSDFTGADLYAARLRDSNFDSCCFVNADLSGATVFRVSFRNADLRGARFSPDNLLHVASFVEVDFSGANLEGVDFTGATYDSLTIFPEGFDPEEHGLKAESPQL